MAITSPDPSPCVEYVFVRTHHNWSDELDVRGCYVAPRSEVETDMKRIEAAFEDGKFEGKEFYFGSNQSIVFDDFDDFSWDVRIATCTFDFYVEFRSLTGGGHGTISIEMLIDYLNSINYNNNNKE